MAFCKELKEMSEPAPGERTPKPPKVRSMEALDWHLTGLEMDTETLKVKIRNTRITLFLAICGSLANQWWG